MAVLMVVHELKSPDKDYGPFYKAIQDGSEQWWHYMQNMWLVKTSSTPDTFARQLYPHMLRTDWLFVGKLQKEYQGWLPEDAWKWINEKDFS